MLRGSSSASIDSKTVGEGDSPERTIFAVFHHACNLVPVPVCPWRNRLPMGSSPGSSWRTNASFTSATGGASLVSRCIQVAAGHQARLHRAKIAGSDVVHICHGSVARARLRLAFQKKRRCWKYSGSAAVRQSSPPPRFPVWSGPYRADAAANWRPRSSSVALQPRNRRKARRHAAARIPDAG